MQRTKSGYDVVFPAQIAVGDVIYHDGADRKVSAKLLVPAPTGNYFRFSFEPNWGVKRVGATIAVKRRNDL